MGSIDGCSGYGVGKTGIAAVIPATPRGLDDLSDEDLFGADEVYRNRVKARADGTGPRKTFESGAVRDSAGKLRYDLIPHEHARELAKVLTIGADKYAEKNWEAGIPFSELYASAARHIASWLGGEERDFESGLLHVSHACWNFMAIETMILRGQAGRLDDLTVAKING